MCTATQVDRHFYVIALIGTNPCRNKLLSIYFIPPSFSFSWRRVCRIGYLGEGRGGVPPFATLFPQNIQKD